MTTTPARFALASRRVVLPEGVRPAAVLIEGQRIAAVLNAAELPAGVPVEDFGDLVIAPGIVDAHVHINEPGRTEWEGFETATRAAAAGGATTLVDMPLNSSPVTTTAAALAAKRGAANGKCTVDVGFYGGLVGGRAGPGNSDAIEALLDAGVLGIKAFLCDSGLPEFLPATADDLRAAAALLARRHRPLLVHAELATAAAPRPDDVRSYAQYAASRPPRWEAEAIELLIDVCRQSRCPVHIVHLANGDALPAIEAARREGLPLSVETCPHYLHFVDADVVDGDTRFKCAPPIRDARHRELLWDGLRRGVIDTIGSDHSPCPPELKRLEAGDFTAAWGGIASLQLTLPVVWTGAVRRGLGLSDVFGWLASAPARLLRLSTRKGSLAAGRDADVVVWDPEARWTVGGAELQHRHKLTPYDGQELVGRVRRTYVRGTLIYDDGAWVAPRRGELLAALPETTTRALAAHLNRPDEPDLREALIQCCASQAWVAGMMAARPFADDAMLLQRAAELWWSLDRDAWLEAFAGHPRIGDLDSLRAKYADTRRWAGGEQAGVAGATEAVVRRLAHLNDEYAARFGYIFIVCATGKSAEEMLALLETRLPNSAEVELPVAAAEQLKITQLRLQKLTP